MMAFAQEELRELAAGGGLTRPLEAAHHDDGGRGLDEVDPRIYRAHQVDELVVDDLHHQLARLEAADHLLPDRLFLNLFGELLDYFEVDVGLEQGRAYLAHRVADVLLAEAAAAGQIAEDVAEFITKRFKHWMSDYRSNFERRGLCARTACIGIVGQSRGCDLQSNW